jgi:hypothetical protein
MRVEIEERTGARVPGRAALATPGGVDLIEVTGAILDDQDVAIALAVSGLSPALDRRVGRDRIRAGITLVEVQEVERDARIRRRHHRVGDADRSPPVSPGAEVRLERAQRAHARDVVIRQRMHGES